MKIERVEIADFRCFHDFKLELTYPEGHPKAGSPLDKICLIGQSGTGKTTLLEFLYHLNVEADRNNPFLLQVTTSSKIWIRSKELSIPVTNYESKDAEERSGVAMLRNEEYDQILRLNESLKFDPRRILYFPVEKESLIKDPYGLFDIPEEPRYKFTHHHFSSSDRLAYWELLKNEVESYQEELSMFRIKISKEVENGNFPASKEIAKELENWRKRNPGVLEELGGKFLDPILLRFHLQVKRELDSLKETNYLPIVDPSGNLIPEDGWTTGTQNIILKTVPLFALKPTENDLILIDEPENSLFPDVQAELVNHYTRLAPYSQIFMATHSPIIASYFEPWEVVDLEFNETGKVIRNEHLIDPKKGWHVDNFDYNPKWLSYEGIYHRYFDFPQNSHPEREEKLNEAASLKREAQYLTQQGKTQEAQQKIKEYQKLAQKLR